MGAGSSKVDWNASVKQQPSIRAAAAPLPVIPNTRKHGIEESYQSLPHPGASVQRSQSARRPGPPPEQKRPNGHNRYASEDAYYYHAPQREPAFSTWHGRSATEYPVAPPSAQQYQPFPTLRNPLPVPPKDLGPVPFAPDYTRFQYNNPPPFVPVQNDELQRRTTKGKERVKEPGSAGLIGRDVLVQQAEPTSSFSSHSSASTSNPPPQVIPSSVYPYYQPSQAMQGPGSLVRESKKRGIFSSLFGSRSKAPEMDPNMLARRRSRQSSMGRAISPPYPLAPRTPFPTRPPLYFYHPDEPGYGFTTFSPHKILYKKKLYPTAEHLYQAMKFMPSKGRGGDLELAERIRTCGDNPTDAVLQARLLNKRARPDWKEMRTAWMDEIMFMKFAQHSELRQELINTYPSDLVFASPADSFWGIFQDGRGRNELGHSLVRVRSRIMHEMGK